VTVTTAGQRTGSTADADVREEAGKQHVPPSRGTLPGCQPAHTAGRGHARTASRKGDVSLCCLSLNTRPSQRNHSADEQHTVSVSTVGCFDRELSGRQKSQETTDEQPQQPRQTDGKRQQRTELAVIKQIHWLRCNAAFVRKIMPCRSI